MTLLEHKFLARKDFPLPSLLEVFYIFQGEVSHRIVMMNDLHYKSCHVLWKGFQTEISNPGNTTLNSKGKEECCCSHCKKFG